MYTQNAEPWMARLGRSDSGSNNISELWASDGATLATIVVGNTPSGIAFDGVYIWVTNYGGNTVTRL